MNFNLDNFLLKIIKKHNIKKKSSTQYTPEDIRNTNDENLIKKINENIIKNMKRKITSNDTLLKKN